MVYPAAILWHRISKCRKSPCCRFAASERRKMEEHRGEPRLPHERKRSLESTRSYPDHLPDLRQELFGPHPMLRIAKHLIGSRPVRGSQHTGSLMCQVPGRTAFIKPRNTRNTRNHRGGSFVYFVYFVVPVLPAAVDGRSNHVAYYKTGTGRQNELYFRSHMFAI